MFVAVLGECKKKKQNQIWTTLRAQDHLSSIANTI